MSVQKPPIDFVAIRTAMAREVEKITGKTCILHEPEGPNSPRPPKPYFGFKMTTPAAKTGDDDSRRISANKYNRGGQRKMTVSFNCYGTSHEEAYSLMGLLQGSFELKGVQEDLKRAGIAVWLIGNVADLSQLLNTGYEGRAQMDVSFGIASNLTEDLGSIDEAKIEGTVETGAGPADLPFDAP